MGTNLAAGCRSVESVLLSEFGSPLQRIERYDLMEPFLMSLVSDSDLWMYLSSLGSMAAGRIDADHSFFPYCTEDVIHRGAGRTGSSTTFRVTPEGGKEVVWRPFAEQIAPDEIERALYKGVLGDTIVFEERNTSLGLVFRYRWSTCDEFGFVRTAELVNESGGSHHIAVLDGVLNLVAAGIRSTFLQTMSVLSDAYTEAAIDPDSGLCTISLASLILDKPEPGEALRATVVWSRGLDEATVLLCEDQRRAFLKGQPLSAESFLRGRRSNYLLAKEFDLEPQAARSWDIVVDGNAPQTSVEALRAKLCSGKEMRSALRCAMSDACDRLAGLVALADGQSLSGDEAADRHHAACVLFNIMRGGIYAFGQTVPTADFSAFVSTRNRSVASKHQAWISALPETVEHRDLLRLAEAQCDPQLMRVAYEYLPLTFSRRHGDPSRPWNFFSIRLKNPDGSPLLAYEGNWRDIFQNWESLSLSYPGYIESIIAKFVNASTIDGNNPYRVTREGIEWETPEEDDPWSSIGYWGDHQVIYLLKLLELAKSTSPDALGKLLPQKLFSYADVPLVIKPYAEMVCDPKSTIDFDFARNKEIMSRVPVAGTDAKLVRDAGGDVLLTTLTEKLLVTALAKLSNLVLDGGIWMNTQRPEWNDANNALVGYGISMVTLCYLRRYLAFLQELVAGQDGVFAVTTEVAEWFHGVLDVLAARTSTLGSDHAEPGQIRELLDALGAVFSDYRAKVYRHGFQGETLLQAAEIVQLCEVALPYLDHSIRANRREDGLYHSYNVLNLRQPGTIEISPLIEMLEGQVAVLSSGVLGASEIDHLVNALFASDIHRGDQNTFMLYPDGVLPRFLQKNIVPASLVEGNPLLKALREAGDGRIITQDVRGQFRFAPDLINSSALKQSLDLLGQEPKWQELVSQSRQATLDAYEAVYNHRFFTGRSRSMYGYEGLGSIYWHMVSKLLVALGECYVSAERNGEGQCELNQIAKGYYRVWQGMGFNKTPHEFGAFPSDPYSHTPGGRGAKQPGMTGQTKEDILARWMELGITYSDGKLGFCPTMLRKQSLLAQPAEWKVRVGDCGVENLHLGEGSLGFTVCGVPIVYRFGSDEVQISLVKTDGSTISVAGNWLDAATSQTVFDRSGSLRRIEIHFPTAMLLDD